MRIAFLSPFYPYRGGIAQFGDSLYLALKNDHKVKAFSFRRQYPKLLFPGKTQLVSENDIDRDVNAERVLDSINPASFKRTAEWILDFKPDLLLISYWMPFFAPALNSVIKRVKAALREQIRVMALMHNVIPHEKRFWDVMLTKKFCKLVDGFIILNNSAQKDLLRLKPDADFIVHQHPLYNHYGEKVDQMDAREKLKIPLNKEVLLYFGFIRDYKGLDILIKAMNHLNEEYQLVIAGEVYGSFEKYRKIINELKLKDKITLHLNYIPENEITYFFSSADVCILPYRTATQSGITGIAYHFDLPVIATNVGGLTDLIEENQTGLIVNTLEDKDMADVIKHYFTNNMRLKMQPYVKMYKAKHSWEGLAKAISDFYDTI